MRCEEIYFETYGRSPEAIAFCPYRISPLGAHIDHQWGKINGLAIDKGIHIAYSINFDPIGKYKRKCWSFQKEVRYRIFGTPMGIGELDQIQKEQQISGHREFIRRILYDDIPVPYQFLFLDLDPVAIETMEIVFGPRMSKS